MIELIDTAVSAAKQAGSIILGMQKHNVKYQMKSDYDILAEADVESEQKIIEVIRKQFPDHSIISEEKGEDLRESDYLWLIDPLDGTINYSRKRNEYCVSIAVEYKGEIIIGVIYQPVTDQLYTAKKGRGAYLNGKKLIVSTESNLINTLLATETSPKIEYRTKGYQILAAICDKVRHIRIIASAALNMAHVASGILDIYYHIRYTYWDFAAGSLLIEEAGGKVTDFEGKKIGRDTKDIIASNGKVHELILEILNSERRLIPPTEL